MARNEYGERTMSYNYTITSLLRMIIEELGKLPEYNFKKTGNIIHLLEMIKEIQDAGPKSLKAARWLGWVLRDMEERGFLTNEQSRNLVRIDVQNGDE